jgi:hypothetical protein
MEPVTLTAGIATLAFGEFINAGAGEIAKKTIAGIEPLPMQNDSCRRSIETAEKTEE